MAKTTSRLTRLFLEALAKHLPPSASSLRLLDINGETGDVLTELRGDLDVVSVPGQVDQWAEAAAQPDSADAVVAYDYVLNEAFLNAAMNVLRPGGRLIVVNSRGEVNEVAGQKLEAQGYTRILVEAAVECPLPTGVLMRGEKPHITADTLERIQQVAGQDDDLLDLTNYKGRYVHLLILQTPNKPAWKLDSGEKIEWQAVSLEQPNGIRLLGFSSLPKAVSLMQPAVMAGTIRDVNKVAKFSREAASTWEYPVLLNPNIEVLAAGKIVLVPVDPTTSEAPDE